MLTVYICYITTLTKSNTILKFILLFIFYWFLFSINLQPATNYATCGRTRNRKKLMVRSKPVLACFPQKRRFEKQRASRSRKAGWTTKNGTPLQPHILCQNPPRAEICSATISLNSIIIYFICISWSSPKLYANFCICFVLLVKLSGLSSFQLEVIHSKTRIGMSDGNVTWCSSFTQLEKSSLGPYPDQDLKVCCQELHTALNPTLEKAQVRKDRCFFNIYFISADHY